MQPAAVPAIRRWWVRDLVRQCQIAAIGIESADVDAIHRHLRQIENLSSTAAPLERFLWEGMLFQLLVHVEATVGRGAGRCPLCAALRSRTAGESGSALLTALAHTLKMGARSPSLAERAAGYIDTHYNQRLTTRRLSARFRVSARTLQRQFRAIYGRSVREYIAQRRLDSATEILTDRGKVEAAARAVGWRSKSSLYRAIQHHSCQNQPNHANKRRTH